MKEKLLNSSAGVRRAHSEHGARRVHVAHGAHGIYGAQGVREACGVHGMHAAHGVREALGTHETRGMHVARGAHQALWTRQAVLVFAAVALLCACTVASAWAEGEQATSSGPAKNEIVYVKASADGQTTGVYAVNYFNTDEAEEVVDPAAYERVENLSTTEELVQENGAVSFTTTAGEPFYYQGDLPATTALPWSVSVSYELDGQAISPEELAGASGELSLTLSVEADTQTENLADFANGYVVQAQGTFDNSTFKLEDGGEATIAQAGESTVATCLVLPGESATVTIRGTATDFEYSGWQISAMPLSLSIDLANADTSELSESTDALEAAILSASTGSDSVSSGAGEVAAGAQSLSDGLEAIDGSSSSLTAGWQSISAAIASARSGADSLATGSTQFSSSVASSKAQAAQGASQLDAAKSAYAQALSAYTMAVALAQAQGQDPANVDKTQLNAALEAVTQASASQGAYTALDGVESGYADLGSGIESLDSGLSALDSNKGSFTSGLSTYTGSVGQAASGSVELAQGAASLSSGSGELASGLSQLVDATSGLDSTILEKLQQRVDEMLGEDFTMHSFVVPSNTNVGAVQFVYVVDGVSVEEAQDGETAEDEETTLLDRLAAVFGM